jgi:hypothetical protein
VLENISMFCVIFFASSKFSLHLDVPYVLDNTSNNVYLLVFMLVGS